MKQINVNLFEKMIGCNKQQAMQYVFSTLKI